VSSASGGLGMSMNQPVKIGPLKESELEEAERTVRVAFGTDASGDRLVCAVNRVFAA
jgi:hypothetical protein